MDLARRPSAPADASSPMPTVEPKRTQQLQHECVEDEPDSYRSSLEGVAESQQGEAAPPRRRRRPRRRAEEEDSMSNEEEEPPRRSSGEAPTVSGEATGSPTRHLHPASPPPPSPPLSSSLVVPSSVLEIRSALAVAGQTRSSRRRSPSRRSRLCRSDGPPECSSFNGSNGSSSSIRGSGSRCSSRIVCFIISRRVLRRPFGSVVHLGDRSLSVLLLPRRLPQHVPAAHRAALRRAPVSPVRQSLPHGQALGGAHARVLGGGGGGAGGW